MDAFEQGAYVWFDHPEETWCPATVLSGASAAVHVALVGSGQEFTQPASSKKFMLMNKQNLEPAPDMVKLGDLHEAALLHNLRLRFSSDDIFTFIGPILVACNPYKRLPIFTPEFIQRYHSANAAEILPPHVYGLANNTYVNMLRDGEDQSVVISGESGAGKTEETKMCLEFLAAVASDDRATTRPEQLLLKSSPILEAMGNAKTIRNNNSSRFGKYMQIRFNRRGKIMGGSIIKYLLEKGRVVRPAAGERNYHIFYLMSFLLKEERAALSYATPEKFRFCSAGGVTTVEGIDDESEMADFREAWDTMGVDEEEVQSLYRVIAAVLHLGNLTFGTGDDGHAVVKLKGNGPLSTVAELFESKADELERTLTVRSMQSGGRNSEVVRIPLTAEQAVESQEGLAKAAYSRVFDWVVGRLNRAVESPPGEVTRNTIGVLDIFGFEIFEENSFEQLCINLANEKLQGHFNNHIFKLEMQVYAAEGLDLTKISFVDNQPIIDLIERKPSGLFPMIDDECFVPQGDDASLLGKLQDMHKTNEYWIKPPRAKSKADELKLPFIVQHYAGRVRYSARGFLTKNRDLLHPDLESYMASSASSFVRALFPASEGPPKRGRAPTLGGQFRTSLSELYVKLTSTAPHFIKCVKTNELKRANMFSSKYCLQQVEYLGLLEVVRIRRQGYPVRRTPENFVQRYAMLDEACPREAGALLQSVGAEGLWQLGKTMVFMKDEQLTLLEAARAICLDKSVRMLQRALAAFSKLGKWRRTAEGFALLGPVCKGGHARGLLPKMRIVATLTTNLTHAMSSLVPRFPPTPDTAALSSAVVAAQSAPSSHGRRRVPGYDELVALSREGSTLQKRVVAESAVLSTLQVALEADDEEGCMQAMEEAAQMAPPLLTDPSQPESPLIQAAVFLRGKAEARQLAIVRENAAEVLDNLSRVLSIDVVAASAQLTAAAAATETESGHTEASPIATAMREKRNALRRAVEEARESGAGADPRVAECEAVAEELGATLDALSAITDAVASGSKEAIVAAIGEMEGVELGAVGLEATQAADRALLEMELSEQLQELEKEQQALRGLGGQPGEEKALQARVDAIIAKGARAGITLEQGMRGPRGAVRRRKRHPLLSRAVLADQPYVLQLESINEQLPMLETFPCLAATQLAFRATGLSHPLTSFAAAGVGSAEKREELSSKSIDAFATLLGWCGAVWHPEPAQQGAALLAVCAAEPLLRDELYMQLLMQCDVDNPDASIARRCWQTLALYMRSGLLPSPALRPYVQAFLFRTIRGTLQTPQQQPEEDAGGVGGRSGLPGRSLHGVEASIVGIAQRCLGLLARSPSGTGDGGGLLAANDVPESVPPADTRPQHLPDETELAARFVSIDDALSDQWVDVQLPDGTHRSFAVDEDTTVCELLLTISVSLRIVQIDAYALYEIGGGPAVGNHSSRRGGFDSLEGNGVLRAVSLDPRTNVASQLRDWKRSDPHASIASPGAAMAYRSAGMPPPRWLALSRRLHVERTAEVTAAAANDPVELHLLYSQALGCVMRGKYTPAEQADAVDLASLSMQADYGDYDPEVHSSGFLRSELAKHIPPAQHGSRSESGWEGSLLACHRKLSGMSATKAKEGYVKRCMACCPGFGTTFFRATRSHGGGGGGLGAKTVLLGVGVEGVTVRAPAALDVVLEHYRFQKLKSWGAGARGAVYFKVLPDPGYHQLVGGEEGVQFSLDSAAPNNSAQELCALLRDYGLWLAARRKREQGRGRQ
jgi:hypothetical protein